MRLRILSSSPLPELRAWFFVGSLVGHSATIYNLKAALCSHFQAFKDANIQGPDILLSLDDFELVNESGINVVRDGDLVSIKPLSAQISSKRKMSHEVSLAPRKRQRSSLEHSSSYSGTVGYPHRTTKHICCLNSSSPSSSKKNSDSHISSHGICSSRSSSCNTSSSSALLGSPLKYVPLTGKIPIPGSGINNTSIHEQHVAPGQGKPTTKRRNLRRRLRKKHAIEANIRSTLLAGCSGANSNPLGIKPEVYNLTSSMTPEQAVFVNARRKKNKGKGSINFSTKIPPKIVFFMETDSLEVPVPLSNEGTRAPRTSGIPSMTRFSRVIPPSERQERGALPHHMFVTTVDVEEGVQRKWQMQGCGPDMLLDGGADEVDAFMEIMGGQHELEGGARTGSQGDEAVNEGMKPRSPLHEHVDGLLDLDRVEMDWNKLPEIINFLQLQPGMVIGWKELAINPYSFTPEIRLKVARIERLEGENVVVLPLAHPGAAQVSFSGILEPELDIAEETYSLSDVSTSKWRIVNITVACS